MVNGWVTFCSLTQVLLIQSYTYFTPYKRTMLIFQTPVALLIEKDNQPCCPPASNYSSFSSFGVFFDPIKSKREGLVKQVSESTLFPFPLSILSQKGTGQGGSFPSTSIHPQSVLWEVNSSIIDGRRKLKGLI